MSKWEEQREVMSDSKEPECNSRRYLMGYNELIISCLRKWLGRGQFKFDKDHGIQRMEASTHENGEKPITYLCIQIE